MVEMLDLNPCPHCNRRTIGLFERNSSSPTGCVVTCNACGKELDQKQQIELLLELMKEK